MCRKGEFWLDANLSDKSGTNCCKETERQSLLKHSGSKHFSQKTNYSLTSSTASVSETFFPIS